MSAVGPPVEAELASGSARGMRSALVAEWQEVGGLGRLATMGVILSLLVAVLLGWSIQGAVRHHMLDVRTEMLERIIGGLAVDGLLPLGARAASSEAEIRQAIEHRVIGGEIVGVTIRDSAGAAVYGQEPQEQGSSTPFDTSVPHVEQHVDGLLHFVLPVTSVSGDRLGTFEVTQQASSFEEVVGRVRRNVWYSIGTGLTTLGIAMGAFTLAHARVLDRRRRHAERLLRDLLHVEDEERRRIVGYLHDDIGQPLYRLMYGLEGCRSRLRAQEEIDAEFRRLIELVRDVDATLRSELHHLHRASLDQLDVGSGLEALARDCEDECGLAVRVNVDVGREPEAVVRSVVLRTVQEALLNVRRHADASHVDVVVRGDDRSVVVEVTDDGRGPGGPMGLGLATARERLESLDGGLTLFRASPRGTTLRLSVPMGSEVAD